MFRDFLSLAASSIAHRRMRSWLTVIGVFIGITAVVALISVGLGLERTIDQEVAKVFGVDTFILMPRGAFARPGGGAASRNQFTLDIDWLRAVDGVRTAAAVRQQTGFVEGPAGEDGRRVRGFFPVVGLSPELLTEFESFLGTLAVEPGGRLLAEGDEDVTILGHAMARQMNVALGDTITVEGDANKEPLALTVVGILSAEAQDAPQQPGFATGMADSADTVFIPYETMGRLWGDAEDVRLTLVKTETGRNVDEVADRAEAHLRAQGTEVSAVTYTDISDAIGTVTSTVSAFLAGIAGISLLVGGVGVMNTMFTSVLERTRDIGIMKAVGASNANIMALFVIESGLIGLVGGIVGTVLGLGVSALTSAAIGRVFDVHVAVVASPMLIFVTLLGSFSLGAFAGLWPARRAAKLPVVDALRYE